MASMVLLALDLIKPKPQQLAECQEEVFNAIVMIWSIPLTTPGPATDKRELREIARALRGAIAALEHPFAVHAIVSDLEEQAGRYVDSEPTEDRVSSLRKELATIATLAEAASERIKVRKGPGVSVRGSGKKLVAAFQALRLLRTYGAEPTLSSGVLFFSWLWRSMRPRQALRGPTSNGRAERYSMPTRLPPGATDE